jgi:hypothetical protein
MELAVIIPLNKGSRLPSAASGKFFEHRVGSAMFGVRCLKRRRIEMNRKMNLVLVLLVVFAGMVMAAGFASCSKKDGGAASGGSNRGAVSDTPKRDADGQYPIGSKVKVYDGNFKPTDAYFTYSPSLPANMNYDNAVILNFPSPKGALNGAHAVLFFGRNNKKDTIDFVRNCIDKSIEWVATAKKNNVRSLTKNLPTDGYDIDDYTGVYMLNDQPNSAEPAYLTFFLYIGVDDEGKAETGLVMNYKTLNEVRSGSAGRVRCFSENDFVRLKEMFSESYLAEIDKQEAAWQKSHAEQDALFE